MGCRYSFRRLLLGLALLNLGCSATPPAPPSPTTQPDISVSPGPTSSPPSRAASGSDGAAGAGAGAETAPSGSHRTEESLSQSLESARTGASQTQNSRPQRPPPKPKTLEDVEGLAGYYEVSSMYEPKSSFTMRESGETLYRKTCARCHGENGSPAEQNETLARYNMAHLRNPLQYKYGADRRGIYRSIAYGTPAPPHGMWKDIYTDQEIWSLAAFVKSLQVAPEARS